MKGQGRVMPPVDAITANSLLCASRAQQPLYHWTRSVADSESEPIFSDSGEHQPAPLRRCCDSGADYTSH